MGGNAAKGSYERRLKNGWQGNFGLRVRDLYYKVCLAKERVGRVGRGVIGLLCLCGTKGV